MQQGYDDERYAYGNYYKAGHSLEDEPYHDPAAGRLRPLQLGGYSKKGGESAGLTIPAVYANDDDMDDEGLLSPRRISQQMDAFGAMCSAGAGWGAALMHALQGHKMTEEQAALCIQSHWRRHEAVVNNIAKGLAAEHIQRVFREHRWMRDDLAIEQQAAMGGDRERSSRGFIEFDAATRINMAWRGHLARARARMLRHEKSKGASGVIRRSLSFSKRSGVRKPPALTSEASPSTPGALWAATANKVRRSLSFDRKGSSSSSKAGAGGEPAPYYVGATRRTFVLERGPHGLGLELDSTNTIVHIKPGGRAEMQGLVSVGDTILTIDGKSCLGYLMQNVMVPGCATSPSILPLCGVRTDAAAVKLSPRLTCTFP